MDPDGAADPQSFLRKLINLYNLQVEAELIVTGAIKSGSRFVLLESTIKSLHGIALGGLLDEAGEYRKTNVSLTGSPYVPPNWIEVPAHMGTFCEYINQNFEEKDLVHLAAFAMWRLNWIHPFRNGNGRISRAVAYMIMCVKFGGLLPPKNTIVQQIVQNKKPYDYLLRNADNIYAGTGDIDASVGGLVAYLSELLKIQIRDNL